MMLVVCVNLPTEDYQLLESMLRHSDASVRSRACSLLGNMLKHSNAFHSELTDKWALLGYRHSCRCFLWSIFSRLHM